MLYLYYIVRKLQTGDLQYISGPYLSVDSAKLVVRECYRNESDVRIFEHPVKGRLYGDRIGD